MNNSMSKLFDHPNFYNELLDINDACIDLSLEPGEIESIYYDNYIKYLNKTVESMCKKKYKKMITRNIFLNEKIIKEYIK